MPATIWTTRRCTVVKRPEVGDRIVHVLPHLAEHEREREGTVAYMLTSMFAYETDEGQTWLVGLNEEWRYADS